MSQSGSSGVQGDFIVMNEDREYNDVKHLFDHNANNKKMSIAGVYKILKKVNVLDEIVMTGLDLDELFNEFNAETIQYEQFLQLLEKFSARKNIEVKILMTYISQQARKALEAGEDGSKSSSSTISSRSDTSNAYTYYPIGHPKHKSVDELGSTIDEAEEGRESGTQCYSGVTQCCSHSVIIPMAVPSWPIDAEDENENREDAGLSGSDPQLEMPGIPLPTQQEEVVPAGDRASKNMLAPARNS